MYESCKVLESTIKFYPCFAGQNNNDRIVKPHRLTQSGVRSDDLVDRASASETVDSGSNPSQVKPTI